MDQTLFFNALMLAKVPQEMLKTLDFVQCMKSMFYPFDENSCMYSHLFKGFYAIFTYGRIVANLNILTLGNGLCMF